MAVRLTLQQADRRERRGIMAALDAAHCLLWFDPAGQVIDANPNVQALLGIGLGDLLGCSYADIAAGNGGSAAYFRTHWSRIVQGSLRAEERDVVAADGGRLWCSLTHAPIRTEEGDAKIVFTLLIDLSPWNRQPKEGLRRIY